MALGLCTGICMHASSRANSCAQVQRHNLFSYFSFLSVNSANKKVSAMKFNKNSVHFKSDILSLVDQNVRNKIVLISSSCVFYIVLIFILYRSCTLSHFPSKKTIYLQSHAGALRSISKNCIFFKHFLHNPHKHFPRTFFSELLHPYTTTKN